MRKKILTVFFMMLFIVTSTLSVKSFAAINSAKLDLNPSKTQYKVGDTVEITLKLSELNADKGIVAYSAVLDYDKDKLEYKGMKGLNGWDNPNYNADNGKFVADGDGDDSSLNGEDLCIITFEAKSEGNNVPIKVTDIEIANGENAHKTKYEATTSINIQDNSGNSNNPGGDEPGGDNPGSDNPGSDNPGGNSGNNNQGGNNSGGNNNSGNNSGNSENNNSGSSSNNSGNNNSGSTSGNKTNGGTTTNKNSGSTTGTSQNTANKAIPQTGIDSNYILASLVMAIIVVSIIAVKMIRVNRKK